MCLVMIGGFVVLHFWRRGRHTWARRFDALRRHTSATDGAGDSARGVARARRAVRRAWRAWRAMATRCGGF